MAIRRCVLALAVVLVAGSVALRFGSLSQHSAALPLAPARIPIEAAADSTSTPQRAALSEQGKPEEIRLFSIFTPLRGEVLRLPNGKRDGAGGAITSVGTNIVLVSHDGDIFIVPPSHQIIKSRIEPPDNGFEAYVADSQRPPYNTFTHNFAWFRYNGIAFVRSAKRTGLAISYTKYHAGKACYTTTVSFLPIKLSLYPIEQWTATSDQWEDLFETAPCLPPKKEWRAIEGHMAGGRIAFDEKGSIVLASGDYSWEGIYAPPSLKSGGPPVAQDPDTDYGKVIEIDLDTGVSKRLSLGQRNMQGIAIDRDGKVWTVEHGMRGGDELNRIEAGKNYGWPYESYGTLYSGLPIPSVLSNGRHKNYERPVFAWLPSVGISGLTRIEGFDEAWNGDLVASTLRAMKLIRLRIEDGRVIFAEDINVGQRIRDVHQHSTGELVLWTDERKLIFLRPREDGFVGRFVRYVLDEKMKLPKEKSNKLTVALDSCRECHSLVPGDNVSAPSLAQIVGAGVASKGFAGYSGAMRHHGGVWTKEELASFIRAPQKVIAGTTMPDPNIGDEEIIDGIVAFLEHLTHTIEAPEEYK